MDRILRARVIARRWHRDDWQGQRAVLQWHRSEWHSESVEKLRWDTQGHSIEWLRNSNAKASTVRQWQGKERRRIAKATKTTA